MKKTLLFIGVIASISFVKAQDCSDLIISEYVEGAGNDKALEIFNPTNSTINLANYTVARFSNGSVTYSGGGTTVLTGTLAPHTAFVLVNGQTTDIASPPSPKCDPALQAFADQLDGAYPAPMYMNGNDAIVLYKNGTSTIVDIFGSYGDATMVSADGWSDQFPYDGSAGVVWTENHTLFRLPAVKKGVTVNPNPFIVTQQWDSLQKGTWTGLGTHVCDCQPASIQEVALDTDFSIYPNPSSNGLVYIGVKKDAKSVEILDINGQVVMRKSVSNGELTAVSTTDYAEGVYMVQVTSVDNTVSQQKLVVK